MPRCDSSFAPMTRASVDTRRPSSSATTSEVGRAYPPSVIRRRERVIARDCLGAGEAPSSASLHGGG